MSLPLFAEDIEEAMRVRRYTPDKHHPCGCVTHFDMLLWRSEAVVRCDWHAAHEASHTPGDKTPAVGPGDETP